MPIENKRFDVHIELKEISEDGKFSGYASTFGGEPDSYGDVIAPGAFAASLQANGYGGNGVKMLWQHDSDDPIGVWSLLREDSKGLYVEGQLALKVQKGAEAYELLKIGAVNAMSIGFRVKRYSVNDPDDGMDRIRILEEVELYEISLVTFPANTNATVLAVKTSVDAVEAARGDLKKLEMLLRDAGFSRDAAKTVISVAKGGNRREVGIDFSDVLLELRRQQESISAFGGARKNVL